VLTQRHDGLASILSNHGDSYRFFRWLNERFNGDLFPGKADSVNKNGSKRSSTFVRHTYNSCRSL
jgi:hypothetical protein